MLSSVWYLSLFFLSALPLGPSWRGFRGSGGSEQLRVGEYGFCLHRILRGEEERGWCVCFSTRRFP